jgi:hypothetical protein
MAQSGETAGIPLRKSGNAFHGTASASDPGITDKNMPVPVFLYL